MKIDRIYKRISKTVCNKKTRKVLIAIILLIFVINYSKQYLNDHTALESEQVTLSKPVDGDTAHFLVNGEDITVRFLAIDTPETVKPGVAVQPFGKEASEFTSQALKNAKKIRLEYEESNRIDKYDRILAYVFVDDQLLQEQLLSKGYAKMTCFCDGYRYSSALKQAEINARENKQGVWSDK